MKPDTTILRIGSGAGFSGDRIDPAVELCEKGDIDYLIFECLGERTIALAQQAKMSNPCGGFDPLLEARMRAVLPLCVARNIRIITNMGAANPEAAGAKVREVARSLNITGLKIAVISGDQGLAVDGLQRLLDPSEAFIQRLYRFNSRRIDAGVSDHVAIGVVAHDQVEFI